MGSDVRAADEQPTKLAKHEIFMLVIKNHPDAQNNLFHSGLSDNQVFSSLKSLVGELPIESSTIKEMRRYKSCRAYFPADCPEAQALLRKDGAQNHHFKVSVSAGNANGKKVGPIFGVIKGVSQKRFPAVDKIQIDQHVPKSGVSDAPRLPQTGDAGVTVTKRLTTVDRDRETNRARKVEGKLAFVPTNTVQIKCTNGALPSRVHIKDLGWRDVSIYVFPAKQCRRCQGWGHLEFRCAADSPKCGKCSAKHETKKCTAEKADFRCPNCSGNHSALGSCPVKTFKNKVAETMTTKGLNVWEARQIVENETKNAKKQKAETESTTKAVEEAVSALNAKFESRIAALEEKLTQAIVSIEKLVTATVAKDNKISSLENQISELEKNRRAESRPEGRPPRGSDIAAPVGCLGEIKAVLEQISRKAQDRTVVDMTEKIFRRILNENKGFQIEDRRLHDKRGHRDANHDLFYNEHSAFRSDGKAPRAQSRF